MESEVVPARYHEGLHDVMTYERKSVTHKYLFVNKSKPAIDVDTCTKLAEHLTYFITNNQLRKILHHQQPFPLFEASTSDQPRDVIHHQQAI